MEFEFLGNNLKETLNNILRQLNSNTTSSSINYTNPNLTDPIDYDSRDKDGGYLNNLGNKERHTEYLWLLIIDLLIFLGLSFISYSSIKKIAAKNNNSGNNTQSEDFKPKFINGLLYANGGKKLKYIL